MPGRRLWTSAAIAVTPLLLAAGNGAAPSHEIVVSRSIGAIVLGSSEAQAFKALMEYAPRGFYEGVGPHCWQVDDGKILLNFCARNRSHRVASIYIAGLEGSFCLARTHTCLRTPGGIAALKATYGSRLRHHDGVGFDKYVLQTPLAATVFQTPYRGQRGAGEIQRVDEFYCPLHSCY